MENVQNSCPKNFTSRLHSKLLLFRKTNTLCDVVIKTNDGLKISAHKIILAAACPYFEMMFGVANDSSFLESQQSEIKIEIECGEKLEILIDYMYGNEKQLVIDSETCQDYLELSNFFQISSVLEKCEDFLKKNIVLENALSIYQLAQKYNCDSLQQESWRFILKNFCTVIYAQQAPGNNFAELRLDCVPEFSESWLSLELEQITKILSSDELGVMNEQQVFESALAWLKHENRRCRFTAKVLTKVRLHLLPASYMVSKVMTEKLVVQSHECRDLLDEAKNRNVFNDAGAKSSPRAVKIRKLMVAGGFGKSALRSVNLMDVEDSLSNKIKPRNNEKDKVKSVTQSELNTARFGSSIINSPVNSSVVIIVGGHDDRRYLSSVESYNPLRERWLPDISPMNTSRSSFGLVSLGTKIIAIGGQNQSGTLGSCESYNLDSVYQQVLWTQMPDLKKKRLGLSACSDENYQKIYVFGGVSDNNEFCNTVEVFEENLWTELSESLNIPRKHFGCYHDSTRSRIFILGGKDSSNHELESCEIFNTITCSIEDGPKLCMRRCALGVSGLDGYIYAIGGYDGSDYLKSNTVEAMPLDLSSGWEVLDVKLTDKRLGATYVLFKTKQRETLGIDSLQRNHEY